MQHLRDAKVLISGIGSVGVEVAKNLILSGVRYVAIHDTRAVEWRDLSAQVFTFFHPFLLGFTVFYRFHPFLWGFATFYIFLTNFHVVLKFFAIRYCH
jgi:hypothetical protein